MELNGWKSTKRATTEMISSNSKVNKKKENNYDILCPYEINSYISINVLI